jgi:hypothetical protein
MTETERAIRRELYVALERQGADRQLLAIVGSWGDTLPDDEILAMLRDHNAGRPLFQSLVDAPRKH